MGLILNRLGENFVSRGLGGGASGNICEIITIDINNEVQINKLSYPLTGIFAGEKGWSWNKTKPQNLSNHRERINNSLGGHSSNLEEGSVAKHWFGSVLSGIELAKIVEKQHKTKRKVWIPKYKPGLYSIFHFRKRLFSNSSSCEILSVESTTDDNTHVYEIKNGHLQNSLSISLFKRDNNFNNIPILTYKYDVSLSEDTSYKFKFDETLNKDLLEFKNLNDITVGNGDATTVEAVQCKFEHLGLGNINRGICYTEYFPITNIRLKTIHNDTVYDWVEVDSFENSSELDRHYIADKETGRILFNNKDAKELLIKKDNVNFIEFYNEINHLPERGFLTFDNEKLYFYAKAKYGVFVLNENKTSRNVASRSTGDLARIESRGKRLQSLEQIYISYTAKPRIDYECINERLFYSDLNIKPYTKIDSNGIIELSPQERHLMELVLTCEKPKIGNNVFGTLFLQGDFAEIKATALNGNQKPVSELDVTFYAEEGTFEGDVSGPTGITKVTNRAGECKTNYYYPYSDGALSTYSDLFIDGANSYLKVDNLGSGTGLNDIAIFQIMKIDPFYRSLGLNFKITKREAVGNELYPKSWDLTLENNLNNNAIEYGRNQLVTDVIKRELEICNGKELNTGMCLIKFKHSSTIIGPIAIEDVFGEDTLRIYTEKRWWIRLLRHIPIDSIWIYKKNELDWEGLGEVNVTLEDKLNNSLNKILYKEDADTSLYKKVTPDRLSDNKLYFDNIHLPMNSVSDRENIIAKYKVIGPKNIKLYAEAIDPATGFTVRSNEIYIKVDLPNYLKSENGFKFKMPGSEESSGFGGANFIAINPDAHINQINFHILDE